MMTEMTLGPETTKARGGSLKRWLPALLFAGLIAAAYASGAHRYFSLATLAEHRAVLEAFVADHWLAAVLGYAALYVCVVALSIPGAGLMSIAGGFLFGWAAATPVVVVAATIGGVAVFQIVRTSLGAALAERAGPMVNKLSAGFAEDAFNYLLFLRLVPAFPFFAVNAVAGLVRVPLKTFIAATLIGIVPATAAFTYLGTGLGSIIDAQTAAYKTCLAQAGANCTLSFNPSAFITRDIIIAFVALGVVALIPVALKRWKAKA